MKKHILLLTALLLQSVAVSVFAQRLPDVLRVCYNIDAEYQGVLERVFFPKSDDKDEELYYRRNIWGFIRKDVYCCIYCIKTKSGYELVGQWPKEDIWKEVFYQVYDTIQTDVSVSWKRNDVRWEDVELDIDITEERLSITNEQALAIAKLFQVAIAHQLHYSDLENHISFMLMRMALKEQILRLARMDHLQCSFTKALQLKAGVHRKAS